jgi:hypothetical protein
MVVGEVKRWMTDIRWFHSDWRFVAAVLSFKPCCVLRISAAEMLKGRMAPFETEMGRKGTRGASKKS